MCCVGVSLINRTIFKIFNCSNTDVIFYLCIQIQWYIFFLFSDPSAPLDIMVIVWKLRGSIIKTALCWIVWHYVHSEQHTYMSSSYRSDRLDLSHWTLMLCGEAVAYRVYDDEMVYFSMRWKTRSLVYTDTQLLSCFWSRKSCSKMEYLPAKRKCISIHWVALVQSAEDHGRNQH